MFGQCGNIKRVKIVLNEDGQSKGFGFVDFESQESAQKALNKSGENLNGREMRIELSLPREFNNT